MTESEYLTAETKPAALLRFTARRVRPRKVQLMAAGFCRMLDADMTAAALQALYVLEDYAHGRVADDTFVAVRETFWKDCESSVLEGRTYSARGAVDCALHPDIVAGTRRSLWFVLEYLASTPGRRREFEAAAACRHICAIIREIAGNPFRPWTHAPAFAGGGLVQPDGLTVPVTSTMRGLAEAIDVGRYFERLPILADALEEGGVTDAELLAHCRDGTNHLPGCWAVDVVLGRS